MNIKIAITTFLSCMAISAMEGPNIDNLNLNKILVEPASLKLAAAWKVATSIIPIPEDKVPTEVLEYINHIKLVLSSDSLCKKEKKFLINIINNPATNINDINLKFAVLIKKYQYILGENNKQKILNGILLFSTSKEQEDIIKLSLILGADINAYSKSSNALAFGSSINDLNYLNYKMVKNSIKATNLKKRKDPKFSLNYGWGPKNGSLSYNTYAQLTPLMIAAMLGNERMVKTLIEAGADVNAQDETKTTALMWVLLIEISNNAIVYYNDIANMLIEANANLCLQDIEGESAQDLINKYAITKKNSSSRCILI